MLASSWVAASTVQSSVTASAGVSGPGAIASASRRNCPTSARQARWPASLSSGTRSSYPGMPYKLATKGFSSSQRRWKRSARSRAAATPTCSRSVMILLLNGVSAGPVSGPALHHVAQPDGRVLDIAVLILPGAYFRGEHPAAVHPGQVVVYAVRSVDEATSERLVKQVIVIRRDLRTQELLAVYEQALQAGLVVHLITDLAVDEKDAAKRSALWVVRANGGRLVRLLLDRPAGTLIAPPIVGYDHTIYLLTKEAVTAVSPMGEVLWARRAQSGFAGAVVTADHRLVLSDGPELIALDTTGQRSVMFRAADPLVTPPLVIEGGRVLVASARNLYLLGGGR